MTITTETIDRLNLIATARPVTEKPVESLSVDSDDSIDFTIPLYVTRIDEASAHRAEQYVGKVVKVRRRTARPDSWWTWDNDALFNVCVHGAKLNPEMVDGHYYRSLDATGLLVRYNDDDHASARNLEGLPLSILAANGDTWPVPGDGTRWADNVQYIEVERPESEPEVMDVHQSNAADGPTWGFAKTGEDGEVALSPDLETGKLYLVWAERENVEWDAAQRLTYVGMVAKPEEESVNDKFIWLGAYSKSPAGVPNFINDTSLTFAGADRDRLKWAELALVAADVDSERSSLDLRTAVEAEAIAFTELNEAMNELADDRDWCSDYESIIKPLGMEGRSKDYYVDVDVDFSFEDSNPSGEFDREAQSRHGDEGLTIMSVRYTAKTSVRIYVSDTTEQGARDYVDSSEIYDRLSNNLSFASEIEVDDWSITDVESTDD